MKTLPDNLIDLLKLTVADVKLCKADEKYIINMNTWHIPFKKKCSVCMAGAVMAKTLNANPKVMLFPFSFDDNTDYKFQLIECIRSNWIKTNIMKKLRWKKPKINFKKYKLADGDLDEWEKLIKDLE